MNRRERMTAKLKSSQEAAEVLGVHHSAVARWRRTGRGPQYIKIGKTFIYREEDIEAFSAERNKRICVVCGIGFVSASLTRKTCSPDCLRIVKRDYDNDWRRKNPEKMREAWRRKWAKLGPAGWERRREAVRERATRAKRAVTALRELGIQF